MKFLGLALVLCLTSSVYAAEEIDQKSQVVSFFQTKMNGKTVSATDPREEDGDFSQSWSYANFRPSDKGFSYEEILTIKQSVYAVDKDGKRTGDPDIRDRMYSTHTEVTYLPTLKKYVGFKTTNATTFKDADPVGSGKTVESITADADGITIKWTDLHPQEWRKAPPDQGTELIRSTHTERLTVENGKLKREFSQLTSIIDPATGEEASKKKPWSTVQLEQ